MAKKPPKIKLDYKLSVVDVHKIKSSPYQVRKFFDEDKMKGLAGSIQQDGLIQSIVVRLTNGHPELIAGERRVQAIRDYTGIKAVPARVVEVSDIQASSRWMVIAHCNTSTTLANSANILSPGESTTRPLWLLNQG